MAYGVRGFGKEGASGEKQTVLSKSGGEFIFINEIANHAHDRHPSDANGEGECASVGDENG